MKAAAAPADPLLLSGREALPAKGIGLAWPRVGVVPLIPPVGSGSTPVPVPVGLTPVTKPVPPGRPLPEGRTPVPLGRPLPEGRAPVPVGWGKPAVPWGRTPVGITKPSDGNTKLPRRVVGRGDSASASASSLTMLAKRLPMLTK